MAGAKQHALEREGDKRRMEAMAAAEACARLL